MYNNKWHHNPKYHNLNYYCWESTNFKTNMLNIAHSMSELVSFCTNYTCHTTKQT